MNMKKRNSSKPVIPLLYYLAVGTLLAYLFRHGGSEHDGWLGFMIFRTAFLLSSILLCYTLSKAIKGDRASTLAAMVHAIALFSSIVRLVFL
jgi:hypothetical protein